MEKRKRGRPAKVENEMSEEKIEGNEPLKNEELNVVERLPNDKDKYIVRSSFFYKGAQFHQGQEIGFSEELFRIGKIMRKEDQL